MQYHIQLYTFKNNKPEKLHSQKKRKEEEEEEEKGLVFIILKLHLYNKRMSRIWFQFVIRWQKQNQVFRKLNFVNGKENG